jgi:transcriptional activator
LGIELAVLGPFRVVVDGDDVTGRVPTSQRAIMALLGGARQPVSKVDLRRIVGLAKSSIDPQLSKLRTALGAPRPVHQGRSPGPGFVALDRTLVATDVDAFLDRVAAGAAAREDGRDREALTHLLAADDMWRGVPFAGVVLLDDPTCQTRVEGLVDDLLAERRRCRELAAWCWLGGTRDGLGEPRLRRWAEELGDSAVCWLAATTAVFERDGVPAASAVVARWREVGSIDADAGSTGLYDQAMNLLAGAGSTTPVPGRVVLPPEAAELLEAAESSRLDGEWDDAERTYLAAADAARKSGGPAAEAVVALGMARLTWDPSRFDGGLEDRLTRLLGELPAEQRLLRARLFACLAGGMYQDGSVDVDLAETYAREALELVGELDDPLTSAEVLSRARKALIDVDPPVVQLERSRRILSLAGRSDYHRSLGLLAAIVDLLWLDRVDDARRETEHYREIAERTRSAVHRYMVAGLDGMWAVYDGRHDDVAVATARAEAFGGRFGGITVALVVQAQRLWSVYERRDLEALEQLLPLVDAAAALERQPIPVWAVAGALGAGVLGDVGESRRRLDAVAEATGDFVSVPRGPLRIATLAIAAMVCADLTAAGHDVSRIARGVHRQLQQHPARGVLVGWPTLYLGPKQRYVDLAAASRASGR